VARHRVQELAGGEDRARQLAADLANGSEIGLTPAQITDDPNMRAIEQTAARQNPALRDRLDRRAAESAQAAPDPIPRHGGRCSGHTGLLRGPQAESAGLAFSSAWTGPHAAL
jgi:hypothetical protein